MTIQENFCYKDIESRHVWSVYELTDDKVVLANLDLGCKETKGEGIIPAKARTLTIAAFTKAVEVDKKFEPLIVQNIMVAAYSRVKEKKTKHKKAA